MGEDEWLTTSDPIAMLDWCDGGEITGSKPTRMVKISDRKFRLIACAACREAWALFADERSRNAVVVAERFADGLATAKERGLAWDAAIRARQLSEELFALTAADCVNTDDQMLGACVWMITSAMTTQHKEMLPLAADIIRDLCGNVFRPVKINTGRRRVTPSPDVPCSISPGFGEDYCPWLTPLVKSLADAAYEERHESGHLDPDRLAVLADEIQNAGCTDQAIIEHLMGVIWCPACNGDGEVMRNRIVSKCPRCDGAGKIIPAEPPRHWRGNWVIDLLRGVA